MCISKAFLTRLDQLIRDPGARLAIREFLLEFGPEMNQRKIRIIDDRLYYSGTIDILTFYELHGQYRTRMKSSLTRQRFLKDLCFEASRKSAKRFAQGNQLASKLYGGVEGEKKRYSLFCFLKRKAIGLIKEGKSAAEAEEILKDYLVSFGLVPEQTSGAPFLAHAHLSSSSEAEGTKAGLAEAFENSIEIRKLSATFLNYEFETIDHAHYSVRISSPTSLRNDIVWPSSIRAPVICDS